MQILESEQTQRSVDFLASSNDAISFDNLLYFAKYVLLAYEHMQNRWNNSMFKPIWVLFAVFTIKLQHMALEAGIGWKLWVRKALLKAFLALKCFKWPQFE